MHVRIHWMKLEDLERSPTRCVTKVCLHVGIQQPKHIFNIHSYIRNNIFLTFIVLLIYIFFMFIKFAIGYKVDVEGRFLYFFMTLSASIFEWQHCCSIISIDGTGLKNKYEVLFYLHQHLMPMIRYFH